MNSTAPTTGVAKAIENCDQPRVQEYRFPAAAAWLSGGACTQIIKRREFVDQELYSGVFDILRVVFGRWSFLMILKVALS